RRRARFLLLRPPDVPRRAGARRLEEGLRLPREAPRGLTRMCTSIVEIVGVEGAGKGSQDWFDLTGAVVSYDHPHHAWLEEAICIDFVNAGLGPEARVAVELTLEGAKALSGALARAIAAAELAESARSRRL